MERATNSMSPSPLVLLGRSGYQASSEQSSALQHSNALVIMAKADASFEEDAVAAINNATIPPNAPLRRVIHASGVQVEARLVQQTAKTMRAALAPKADAFHRCTRAASAVPLEMSLLFSSVSSITGNANHANYAGANACVDALAEQFSAMGTPVVAVQWGAWASVGMVHSRYRISSQQAAGMGMLSSDAGLSALHYVLRSTQSMQNAVVAMRPVVGAAPTKYWTNLLQSAPTVPAIFSAFDIAPQSSSNQGELFATAAVTSVLHPSLDISEQGIEMVVKKVACSILGIDQVDVDQPLALQGLDSLASLELRQKLQEALGVQLALLAEDPQGATVTSIVDEALPKLQSMASSAQQGNTSIVSLSGLPSNISTQQPVGPLWISPTPVSVKMRLFCLPWAGGISENLFARWSMMLPASVQVCPIEIPGRGRREGETALTTVDELAKLLAHSLPLQDKPYAIFGTCLGAIVGYEIIREAERTGCAPLPLMFMPAAVSPPHVYASVVMKIYLQRRLRRGEEPPLDEVMRILRDWKDLPREKLLLAFEAGHFAGVEEMKKSERLFNRVAPMGVNDIMMAVQYRYDASRGPLNVPIVAFDGSKDNTIPKGYMKGWKKHTTRQYRHVVVPGTHYFVSTHFKFVTSIIRDECLEVMESMKGGILGAGHSWVRGAGDADDQPSGHHGDDGYDEDNGGDGGGMVGILMRDYVRVATLLMMICMLCIAFFNGLKYIP